MSHRTNANVVLLLLVMALAIPAAAWANSGGAASVSATGGTSAGASGGSAPTGGTQAAQPAGGTATVSGGGVTLSAHISALLQHQLRFTGSVPAGSAGESVLVQRLASNSGWVTLATATVAQGGSFSALWRTNHTGRFPVRVVVQTGSANSSRAAAESPTLEVTVYRSAIATTYGPGFYGSRTACGKVLRRNTLGVANRSLPCGTPIGIYYGGRTIVVPVIDRGPYANGASWDLTQATARALRIPGTVTLGAAALPSSGR